MPNIQKTCWFSLALLLSASCKPASVTSVPPANGSGSGPYLGGCSLPPPGPSPGNSGGTPLPNGTSGGSPQAGSVPQLGNSSGSLPQGSGGSSSSGGGFGFLGSLLGGIFSSFSGGSKGGGSSNNTGSGSSVPQISNNPSSSPPSCSPPSPSNSGSSSQASLVNLSNPNSVASFSGTGNCSPSNYGLPQGAAPGTVTQYPQSGSLSQLPSLSLSAQVSDLKTFVTTVYDTFPVFSQIYQAELGLTEVQALAFMFADMSRESAAGNGWTINGESGQGTAGDAWGPFQAAVTNFTGGGYDSDIEDYSGLPIPNMAQFKDPATSTYAGMKRLADGILHSMLVFGLGQPAQTYLLGSLADHNTGWPQNATSSSWLNNYGYPVLTMMQGYLYAPGNLTSNYLVGNGESSSQMCGN